jgi:hypothetical protein
MITQIYHKYSNLSFNNKKLFLAAAIKYYHKQPLTYSFA